MKCQKIHKLLRRVKKKKTSQMLVHCIRKVERDNEELGSIYRKADADNPGEKISRGIKDQSFSGSANKYPGPLERDSFATVHAQPP
jgi:hypothetical protein